MQLSLLLNKNRKYAICASESEVLMADIQVGRKGEAVSVHCLSSSSRDIGDDITVNRLLTGIDRKKARVALVLPLSAFEIVTVTVPPVPREAAARLLPYNLSKVINRPVTDFIYDWQVAQRFKDRYELTVYLYPVAEFQKLRLELQGRQKEITWFEPDVFAACSYLEGCGKIPDDGSFICVLVWQESISMVVYEHERVALVRSVDLVIPEGPYRGDTGEAPVTVDMIAKEQLIREENVTGSEQVHMSVEAQELVQGTMSNPFFFEGEDDILAGFGLQHGEDVSISTSQADSTDPDLLKETGDGLDWKDYLQNINLELMRTADYHTSVLKGKSIKKIFIGGEEPFHDFLEKGIKEAMGVTVERFPPVTVEADFPEYLAALSIGALQH